MDDREVELVLRCVEQIPPGRVASYGQLGEIVGMGARQVGRVLATWGNGVPWWRVTNAAGELPEHLRTTAAAHWEREGVASAASGRGCRIAQHRVDSAQLAAAWAQATADLREG